MPNKGGRRPYGLSKLEGRTLSPLLHRSHIARSQFAVSRGGTIDIIRRNANFGDAEEAGVMFVGFFDDIDAALGMLKQMCGVGPDGVTETDALLDYSTGVSGAVYFVPLFEALQQIREHGEGSALKRFNRVVSTDSVRQQ